MGTSAFSKSLLSLRALLLVGLGGSASSLAAHSMVGNHRISNAALSVVGTERYVRILCRVERPDGQLSCQVRITRLQRAQQPWDSGCAAATQSMGFV
ncbi:MAG: hypothetical protein B7X46_14645 [Thiomonas sp. 15-66-11]|nr:MAG: hypothetical protein B7X46_14645 [Thiomonas sp. 15-66-11]